MRGVDDVSRPAAGVLGDFRIIRELGRGGMGIVYEAEQISLSRRVALKVLPFAAVLDPRHLQRFKNEALAAAHLAHPNIVDVYGVGCERSIHFYAMRLIEGQTLAAVIDGLRLAAGGTPTDPRSRAPRDETTPLPSRGEAGRGANDWASSASVGNALSGVPEPPNNVEPSNNSPFPIRQSTLADTRAFHALSTLRTDRPKDFFRLVAELGIQAAEALDHAHQMGIVHRDIKPSNLILECSHLPGAPGRDGAAPRPLRGEVGRGVKSLLNPEPRTLNPPPTPRLWITDFGLARFQNEPGMTMTGDLVGTLRYMSPEQALAKRVTVDHRADIYSLGITLYELLALVPAFNGTDREEILRQIAFEDPTPLRRRKPSIPAELETIIHKAISKNPDDRYATARELADDLARFSADQPIRAKPPTRVERLLRWSNRHRALVAIAAVLLVVSAALASAVAVLFAVERDKTVAALDDVDRERERAEVNYLTARQAVSQMLKQVADERLNAIREIKDVRSNLLKDAIAFYTKLLQLNPTDVQAYAERAEVYALLGKRLETIADYEKVVDLQPNNCIARLALADLYSWYFADAKDLTIALTHAEHVAEIEPNNAMAEWHIAVIHGRQGHMTEARQRLVTIEKAYPLTSQSFRRLASAYGQIGDYEAALPHARRAVALDPTDAYAHDTLGYILDKLGKRDEAFEAYSESIRLVPFHFGIQHQGAHWRRGEIFLERGEYAKALEDLNRAADIQDWDYIVYKRRAVAHFLLKNYDQSLADIHKAFEMKPDDVSTLIWVGFHRIASCEDHRYRKAILDMLERATEKQKTRFLAYYYLSAIHAALGHHEQAFSDFQAAIDASANDDERLWAYNDMAWMLVTSPVERARDANRAIELANKSLQLRQRHSATINTLGVAHYRAGKYPKAFSLLMQSNELEYSFGYNGFFLAMCSSKTGDDAAAADWYARAVAWMEKNQPQNKELLRFRAEAEELLGIKTEVSKVPVTATKAEE